MELYGFSDDTLLNWVVIPLLIMLARVVDVSIGTVRVIFVARGMKILTPMPGFLEVLIWLVVIGQIMQNLSHWVNYFAYAAGFALGNYIGIVIEQRIALGRVLLRIITRVEADLPVKALRDAKFGVTGLDAEGRDGPVKVIFLLVERNKLPEAVQLVNRYNPRAFYSIEDVRFVSHGVIPPERDLSPRRFSRVRKMLKKWK